MTTLASGQTEPISSGEVQIINPDRVLDIAHKHRLVSEFLELHHYDALLLQQPPNFAWFTSGGDCSRAGSSETTASLFITPEARLVVTTNADSAQIFDHELPGLGFQLKERTWHESRDKLIDDLCRGRTVASDGSLAGTQDVSVPLARLQTPLTALECQRARELGRLVAHAVEAVCRNCRQGQSEAEIAGEVAHRLIKRRVVPERIQVFADAQAQRYRHWAYGNDRVERCVTVSAVGRRWGLCLGAARTVSFGPPPQEIRDFYHRAVLVQATGIYFSQSEWELFEIWNRVRRIYEKHGLPNEWRQSEQGQVIGYRVCELPIVPNSQYRLTPGTAVYWHPSVGPAVLGDSILVGENRPKLLTPMESWPKLKIVVKGVPLFLPQILRRTDCPDSGGEDSNVSLEPDDDDSQLGPSGMVHQ